MSAADLRQILRLAAEAREGGRGAAVATVVRSATDEATPGSRAFIDAEHMVGSLHPSLDQAVRRDAMEAVERGRPGIRSYILGEAMSVGIEGGDIDVFFDVIARPPVLLVVGAGHIAVPLVEIGGLLGFKPIVLDDRPEYATAERFPRAHEILIGPYRPTIEALDIERDTAVVLVTRGHVHDRACLEVVISSPAHYIGMIGSKRRVRTVLENMAQEGHSLESLRNVRAPIGLDIAAHTPAEIAVAIMAEIISVRNGGTGKPMSVGDKLRV